MNLNIDWQNPYLFGITLNTVLIILAFLIPKKLLTPFGYLNGWFLGVTIWATLQWQGYLIVMFYFVVGSLVTRIGIDQKEEQGIAEKRGGMRGVENVWGSALTALLCAIGTLFVTPPLRDLLVLGYVASFATKLSDTCASEIGKAMGKNTFLITTLQPVARGTEGAISLEGTLAGILASLAIAIIAYVMGMINLSGVIICIISAFIATNLESLIGATLQTKYNWLTNEIVNFINTLIGAILAILLGKFI